MRAPTGRASGSGSAGGDPYHPTGPFLPYVYAPWILPIFTPWALLPWDVAWFAWRGASIFLLAWTVHWAYGRRPIATVVALTLLAFPIAANLDTGNLTLILAFMLWAAQFAGPRLAGLLWALATWAKWVPAPAWLILQPRGRAWGLVWLGLAVLLSLATLPLTIVQLETLFGFGGRPVRLDYLVLLWAAIPWLWRHPNPLWWIHPREWPVVRERASLALARGRAALGDLDGDASPLTGIGRRDGAPRGRDPGPLVPGSRGVIRASATAAPRRTRSPPSGRPRSSSPTTTSALDGCCAASSRVPAIGSTRRSTARPHAARWSGRRRTCWSSTSTCPAPTGSPCAVT